MRLLRLDAVPELVKRVQGLLQKRGRLVQGVDVAGQPLTSHGRQPNRIPPVLHRLEPFAVRGIVFVCERDEVVVVVGERGMSLGVASTGVSILTAAFAPFFDGPPALRAPPRAISDFLKVRVSEVYSLVILH